jgi:RND family efflux transporter MFP subunit
MSAPVNRPAGFKIPSWTRSVGGAALLLAAGAAAGAGGYWKYGPRPAPPEPETAAAAPKAAAEAVVRLAESKWPAAGVRIEPAASGPFVERVWRTGRVALDETRVAHVTPVVEGLVRKVEVRLGQEVKAGDVLAYLDSREVGQARLELVKARLAADTARVQYEWTATASKNAADLVEAMAADVPVAEIEGRFKNRTIGDLRHQLVSAYSRRLLAKANHAAADAPNSRDSVPQSTLARLRAEAEAAEAAFLAACEEARYQTGQQARAAEQKYREAHTAESLARTQLIVLGFPKAEVEKAVSVAEGADVALYPIRAPFAGTVIEQHAVLAERVGPQSQMFRIADLSTLWLHADIPQRDLSLLRPLGDGKVRFREPGAPDGAIREADVLYTGDVVETTTRAVALTAVVPNPDRALKAGMFVEVELARPGREAVQLPAAAVQRQGTQAFVFVHAGGDEFRRADVRLGRTSGEVVEVVEGLERGQSVAVAGGFVLKSELMRDQMVGE